MLYTKPGHEDKVAQLVQQKGIQSYCPHHSPSVKALGWKKTAEPLFRSYVFVRSREEQLPELKQLAGVVNVVYRLSKPAVVGNEDMAVINRVLHSYDDVQVVATGFKAGKSLPIGMDGKQAFPLSSLGCTLMPLGEERSVASAAKAETLMHNRVNNETAKNSFAGGSLTTILKQLYAFLPLKKAAV